MRKNITIAIFCCFLSASLQLFAENKPAAFTENKGQFRDQDGKPNPEVLYMADFGGMKVQLRKTGFSYETYQVKPKWVDPASIPYKILTFTENGDTLESWPGQAEAQKNLMYHFHRVDVELVGAKLNPEILAEGSTGETKRYVNAAKGGESIEVEGFSQVRHYDVYPGIDLVFYSQNENGGFKYDFVLRPGANLSAIELEYKGAESLELEKGGNLNLKTRFGMLSESIPACYTEDATGNRKEVSGISYQLEGNKLRFTGKTTQFNEKLVIDPAVNINWAKYFGGDLTDYCVASVIDLMGNNFLCGNTMSSMLATEGVYQDSLLFPVDGFLAKYNKAGELLWATYLNGLRANDIDINQSNELVIAGDIGLTKFDSAGTFHWFVNNSNTQTAIALDNSGNIVTVGDSVVKFSSAGSILWKMKFGGSGTSIKDVDCDVFGNIYFVGHTTDSTGVGTPDSHLPTYNGTFFSLTGWDYNYELIGNERSGDGFIGKLNPDGQIIFSTYYGGKYFDIINRISVSDGGYFVIAGETNSRTGISSPGSHKQSLSLQGSYGFMKIAVGYGFDCPDDYWPLIDTCVQGGYYPTPYDTRCQSTDAFIAKFSPDGIRIWGTYYGDNCSDFSTRVDATANCDTISLAGISPGNFCVQWSSNCPPSQLASYYSYLKAPNIYRQNNGGTYAYLAQFDSTGNRSYGTCFPKQSDVQPLGTEAFYIAEVKHLNDAVFVSGTTLSENSLENADNAFVFSFAISDIDTIFVTKLTSVCISDSALIMVGVPTSPLRDLSFWWSKNGITIPGATDSSLMIPTNYADTGWYCYHISQGNFIWTDSIHFMIRNNPAFNRSDLYISSHNYSDCKVADFNEDGKCDFTIMGYLGGYGPFEHLVYSSSPDGYIIDTMPYPITEGSFCLADLDKDNDIDLIAAGDIAGYGGWDSGMTYYYSSNDGQFNLSKADTNKYFWPSFDFADYDHDGDYDLLVHGGINGGSSQGQTTIILANDSGNFSFQGNVFPAIRAEGVAFGDYNNDMMVDVLTTGGSVYQNVNGIYTLNQSFSPAFTPVLGYTGNSIFNASAAWGDLDADGDLDLIVSGATHYQDPKEPKIFVYINNNGFFVLNAVLDVAFGFRTTLGDIDNDGFLDIVNGKDMFLNVDGTFVLKPTTYSNSHTGLQVYVEASGQSLADYDDDGDLDIITAYGIYKNDVCNAPNTPPTPPFSLTSAVSNDTVFFSWQRANDLETPQMGLTYNLRVSTTPGDNDIMSSMSNESGWRKIVSMGNVYQNTGWWLHNLKPGTYYWSVQAIDNSFAGGPFAPEQTFEIPYPATHNITIPEGWSGLSSWAFPHNPAIEQTLLPIQNQLTILQTMDAFYFPSQNTNTIGNWDNQTAFKIKVTDDCLLNITGIQEQNKNLALEAGWNLMPVICNLPVDAVQLFAGISNDLKIAKDVAGSGVYWPEYSINSIGSLLPGKAYFVKMNNAGTITFPPNDFSGLKASDFQKEPEEPSPWGWVYKTPSSHIFAIPANITNLFGDKSFVGAFTTEGVCAGVCSIKKGQSTVLVVNPDDPITPEKEGFTEGEPLIFRVWDTTTGKDFLLKVEYDLNQPDHSGIFTANGISAIRNLEMLTSIQEQPLNGILIFPNPTKEILNISGIRPGTIIQVSMISADGKTLFTSTLFADGQIDVSDLSKGIYFLKLEDGVSVRYEKVVIN